MHPRFLAKIDTLEASCQKLLASDPVKSFNKNPVVGGVYLFSEAGRHLYIGRTNNICRRYGLHCNPGSQQNQATFAFRLAREATGKMLASYRPGEGSRVGLLTDPAFSQAFQAAKAQVKNMEFRYVVEPDQTKQALLEIYCAVALETPYNSFKTS